MVSTKQSSLLYEAEPTRVVVEGKRLITAIFHEPVDELPNWQPGLAIIRVSNIDVFAKLCKFTIVNGGS
jgi:hypothetical protein